MNRDIETKYIWWRADLNHRLARKKEGEVFWGSSSTQSLIFFIFIYDLTVHLWTFTQEGEIYHNYTHQWKSQI